MFVTDISEISKLVEDLQENTNYARAATPFQFLKMVFENHPNVSDDDLSEVLNFELKIASFSWKEIISEYRKMNYMIWETAQ